MPNSKTQIDSKFIRELAKLVDETGLNELEYESEGVKLRFAKGTLASAATYSVAAPRPMEMMAPAAAVAPAAAAPAAETKPAAVDYSQNPGVIKSPMVGTVYLAPEPGAPCYVKEGDTVTADQTLMLIEAMKTFNPVKASKGGRVTKILVEDGMPVEYGQPLMVVE